MRSLLCVAAILVSLVSCESQPPQNTQATTSQTATSQTATTREAAAASPSAEKGATTGSLAPTQADAIATETRCTPDRKRLCPEDGAVADPSFVAFRSQLLQAVHEKSESRLMALVDPAVRTSFGSGGGSAAFRKSWKTSSPDSPLWTELSTILALGGAFEGQGDDRTFWAPYVYANWPESVDAFQHCAAIRQGVPIRAGASLSAPIVTTVDWAVLELMSETKPQPDWRHVRTSEREEGWVRAADVRSPVGYRAGFSKRKDRWLMVALVSGD